jgi:DNA (cytosine-5)-methyltransferase 1
VIRGDIQQLESIFGGSSYGPYPAHAGLDNLVEQCGGIDVVIGGPPCQAYSMAGRVRDANGMQLDYRNYLFESYLLVVQRYRPVAFVFENVPGMLSAAPGGVSIRERISASFLEAGYQLMSDLRECVIDAADYGVAQRRRRVIIVGIRGDVPDASRMLDAYYTELAAARSEVPVTVGQAIGDLPALPPLRKPLRRDGRQQSHSGGSGGVPDHEPRFHSTRDQEIFRLLARDRMRKVPRYSDPEALKALYTERTGHVSAVHKYHVLGPDEPSNLIPAHLHKDGLRHIHFDPKQARSITVREAADLQGFPRDFKFLGSQGDRYKMIGNAVPPPLARVLADTLATTVFKNMPNAGRKQATARRHAPGEPRPRSTSQSVTRDQG